MLATIKAMDIQKLLKEAESLQKLLMGAQKELGNIEVEGNSKDDLVRVLMNAQGVVKDIKIKKEAVNPNDIETLEDLILSAFRDATNKAVKISQEKLGKLSSNKE